MIKKARSSLCLSFLSSSTASTASTGSAASTPSCRSTFLASAVTTTAGCEPMEEWIYWQRDETKQNCWTKVYAVLQNEFLLFFQQGVKSRRSLLLQIAVSTVEESGDRKLRIVDPNGEAIEIYLLHTTSFESWRQRLQDAATITAQFFQFHEVDVKSLPRNSAYRGSLVAARRVTKRSKCKQAIANLALKWRQSLLSDDPRRRTV